MDPAKHGIDIELENIFEFRELCFTTNFFRLKIVLIIIQL